MAIKIRINNGWVYLAPTEKRCIIGIMQLLENARTRDKRLHTRYFQDRLNVSSNTISHALFLLCAAHILKPQQYGRVRLYTLVRGARYKLKTITSKIGKDRVQSN